MKGQVFNQSCCALDYAKDRQAQIPRAVHAFFENYSETRY